MEYDAKLMHHIREGIAPFHVLGPNMPCNWNLDKNGKYKLYWEKNGGNSGVNNTNNTNNTIFSLAQIFSSFSEVRFYLIIAPTIII